MHLAYTKNILCNYINMNILFIFSWMLICFVGTATQQNSVTK